MASKSQEQHDAMLKAVNNKAFADKTGISQKTAKAYLAADEEAELWQTSERSEIDSFVACLPDMTKKNVEVVEGSDLDFPYFLHITPEKSPKYIPRIGTRQMAKEDRTTPRITVADTLIGCYVGYSSLLDQFFNQSAYMAGKEVKFNNGLYIRKIPFRYALLPNTKLVPDQRYSNEHWLVNYSPSTTEYASTEIGKFFISSLKVEAVSGKSPEITGIFFLSIKEPIKLTSDITLEPGYFMIELLSIGKLSYTTKRLVNVTEITKDDFDARKVIVAANLSATDDAKLPVTLHEETITDKHAVALYCDQIRNEYPGIAENHLSQPDALQLAYVAKVGNAIAGRVVWHLSDGLVIDSLTVLNDYQCQGVGKKLLDLVKGIAASRNLKEVVTRLPSDSPASLFFLSNGFGYLREEKTNAGESVQYLRHAVWKKTDTTFFRNW